MHLSLTTAETCLIDSLFIAWTHTFSIILINVEEDRPVMRGSMRLRRDASEKRLHVYMWKWVS